LDSHNFIMQEMSALREELHSLKHCQITFLTYSVAATGILLGVGTVLGSTSVRAVVFLFPLIFILPAWWIFFDKATTVTRIVGYYRILEGLSLETRKVKCFTGWENSLREFRHWQERKKFNYSNKDQRPKPWRSKVWDMVLLKTGHRYWLISCFVFFALSGLCVIVSIVLSIVDWRWHWLAIAIVAAVVFLISTCWNARLVWQLIYGRHSYNCNEDLWEQVLNRNELA